MSEAPTTIKELTEKINALQDQINQISQSMITLLQNINALKSIPPPPPPMPQPQQQPQQQERLDPQAIATIGQLIGQFMQPRSDPLQEVMRTAMADQLQQSVRRGKIENMIIEAVMKGIAKKVGVEAEEVAGAVFE